MTSSRIVPASWDQVIDDLKAAQGQRDGLRVAVETLLTKGRVEHRMSGNVWMLAEADRTALELVVKLSQPPTESNPWRDVPADLTDSDPIEDEPVRSPQSMVCADCDGTGQTGMQRDGQPIECRTCDGRGWVNT